MTSPAPTVGLRPLLARSAMLIERAPTTRLPHTNKSSFNVELAILIVFVVVAGLPVALGYLWLLYRRRTRRNQRHEPSPIGLGIMNSNVIVEVGDYPSQTPHNGHDLEARCSSETIFSPSPQDRLLRSDSLANISITPPKEDLSSRRGRSRLRCDTKAQYAIDAVAAGPAPRSTPTTRARTLEIPVFGFDEQTITPPVGSPLWGRKPDSAGIPDSPRRIVRLRTGPQTSTSFDLVSKPGKKINDEDITKWRKEGMIVSHEDT